MPVERPNQIGRVALGDAAAWSARRAPDETAFIVPARNKEVTFRAFNDRVNQAAHAFVAAGLEQGDRVGFVTGNSERMLAAEFGALKAGLVTSLNNTQLDPDTMTYQLENAEADAVVVDNEFYPKVEPYLDHAGISTVISIDWTPDAVAPAEAFESFIEGQPTDEPVVEIERTDPALIMYTSGTTSRPKGVLHTHESYSYNTANVMVKYDIHPNDVVGNVHPLFHIVETFPRCAFAQSATSVIFREFHPNDFLAAVETHGITTFYLMASVVRQLLKEGNVDTYDLSSVRRVGYGMPLELSTRQQVIDTFDAELQLAMGQTEAGILMFLDHEWQLEKDGNYIGRSGPFGDAAIMDDDGTLLPPGEVGEIVFRSPAIMDRYVKNEEQTKQAWEHGWHHTEDVGKFDEDGLLLFIDRQKDIVKTGGENVSTTKVQNALGDHPAVEEAAIVGLPHDRWGEAVTAFVVRAEGAQVTDDELIDHAAERLADFETPKAVEFVDDLPQTATGKIRKVEVAETHHDYYA